MIYALLLLKYMCFVLRMFKYLNNGEICNLTIRQPKTKMKIVLL